MSKPELEAYTGLQSNNADPPNIYETPSVTPTTSASKASDKRNNIAFTLLIIATAVNSFLLIVFAATCAHFERHNRDSLNALNSALRLEESETAIDNAGTDGATGLVSGGGAVYTRWGKSSCPSTEGTQLLYSGTAGGSHYNSEQGGASNYLCLPSDPEYNSSLTYRSGAQPFTANLWAAQYDGAIAASNGNNVFCAVCYVSTRPTVVMIPAKASCPPTWTREYHGYLMASSRAQRRTMYECVDASQEFGADNQWGAEFTHVEAQCGTDGGLPCPPYSSHQEINCVVCTK